MFERSTYHETYARIAGAVAYVAVRSASDELGIGSAFHIGNGIFVTARHVVDGQQILEVATTKSVRLPNEGAVEIARPRFLHVVEGPFFGSTELDVAVFRVELNGAALPYVKVSPHTGYDIEENDLELSDVLIVGYPPIPFTTIPYQIVTLGQINAVVKVRHSPIIHMIVSAMARGGFSGGVAVDKGGIALGLVTESLGDRQSLVETGYMSLLSIEAAVDLAAERFGFDLASNNQARFQDLLIGIKMAKSETIALSTSIVDAEIYVYDDDHDIFLTIACVDPELLHAVTAAFDAVAPVSKVEEQSNANEWFLGIEGNPSATTLVSAAEAALLFLEQNGYVELSAQRNTWQLKSRA